MNALLMWTPLIVVVAVVWSGHGVMHVIHAANLDRRNDHKEMMEYLELIAERLSDANLELGYIKTNTDKPSDVADWD